MTHDRQAARPPRPALLIPGVVSVVLVVVTGFLIAPTRFDLAAVVAANSARVGPLAFATAGVYRLVGPVPAIALTVVLTVVVIALTRRVRVGVAFAAVVAITWIPSALVKLAVDRHRPPASVLPHPLTPFPVDPSYPSGHEVFVTALVIALVALLRGRRARRIVAVAGVVAVFLVGFALVTDGVHYPSDVIASVVWSAGVAVTVRAIWMRWVDPRIAPVDRVIPARLRPT